jgi:hypothetical protein
VPTYEELVAARDRAAPRLLRLLNVTSVGIGGRVRGGERIPELVLKVCVDLKVAADQLEPSDRIPSEIDGLPTDVRQMSTVGIRATATDPPQGQPRIPVRKRDNSKYRPINGGCRIESALPDGGWGTLGCVMVSTTAPNKAYALTCWHVMRGQHGREPTIGTTKAGQPTHHASRTKSLSHIIGTLVAGAVSATTDAALIELEPGIEWTADVIDIGPLAGEHPIGSIEAWAHPAVRMRGDLSPVSGGHIESVLQPVTFDDGAYSNIMLVMPTENYSVAPGEPYFFGQRGDSGSVVVNDANQVVGVFLGLPEATRASPYVGAVPGWVLPIADINAAFTGLPFTVPVAATAGIIHTVPGT